MREHVEHARSRRLAERVEVGRPDLVGIPGGPPDVPIAAHVDCIVADEVNGADDVVPVVLVEQRGHAVLAPRHVVRLDPQPQAGAAGELGVFVQVVDGPALPERVLPDVERAAEAVHVLGHAELVDASVGRNLAVALDVRVGEIARGRRVVVVGTQVEVVVGQHRSISAMRMSSAVVTLKFSGKPSTTRTRPPTASTRDASSVSLAGRPAQGVGTEHLRGLRGPQAAAIGGANHLAGLDLLHGVGYGNRRDRPVVVAERIEAAPHQVDGHHRARSVVNDDDLGFGRRVKGGADGFRACATARDEVGRLGAVRGNGDDYPVADLAQDIEAPFDHRSAA